MTKRKLVYIASPLAGEVEKNQQFARDACRFAVERGMTPIASHLLFPQFLKDEVPAERELGIKMGLQLVGAADELWVCGDKISPGMQAEIARAEQLGIPIRSISRKEIQQGFGLLEGKRWEAECQMK